MLVKCGFFHWVIVILTHWLHYFEWLTWNKDADQESQKTLHAYLQPVSSSNLLKLKGHQQPGTSPKKLAGTVPTWLSWQVFLCITNKNIFLKRKLAHSTAYNKSLGTLFFQWDSWTAAGHDLYWRVKDQKRSILLVSCCTDHVTKYHAMGSWRCVFFFFFQWRCCLS